MLKKIKNKKGFTLIELITVISIISIMVVFAVPQFINASTQAKQAARDGVVGSVRAALAMVRSNDMVVNGPPGNYPATLDTAAAGPASPSNLFFSGTAATQILQQGIADTGWTKVDDTHYNFSDGSSIYNYTYDPSTGSFSSPTAP